MTGTGVLITVVLTLAVVKAVSIILDSTFNN